MQVTSLALSPDLCDVCDRTGRGRNWTSGVGYHETLKQAEGWEGREPTDEDILGNACEQIRTKFSAASQLCASVWPVLQECRLNFPGP